MKPEHYFFLCIGITAAIFIYYAVKHYRKNRADKFDKIPFVFYMHGKRFTPEEASEYYDIQKIRRVDPYLMIYDTESKEYTHKCDASLYFEKDGKENNS